MTCVLRQCSPSFEQSTGIALSDLATWQYASPACPSGRLMRASVNKMVPSRDYAKLKPTTPVFGVHFDPGPSITVVLVLVDDEALAGFRAKLEGGDVMYSTRADGLIHEVVGLLLFPSLRVSGPFRKSLVCKP